jgi:rhamnulose-1-phosphate aldolase
MGKLGKELWQSLLHDAAFCYEMNSLVEIGSLIWQRGWAEANAGNVSVRLPKELNSTTKNSIKLIFNSSTHYAADFEEYIWFLVSASGSRYREFSMLGFDNFMLVGINGKNFNQIIYPAHRKITSEWPTHHAIHKHLFESSSVHTIVLHVHPTDWITLCNCEDYCTDPAKVLNHLSTCLPELDIYLPNGIARVPIVPPGSEQLAELTLAALNISNVVVWEKHGVVVTAEDINKAFDYLEIASKAAAVYLAKRK